MMTHIRRRATALAFAALLLAGGAQRAVAQTAGARASEVHVVSSGGFAAAYKVLVPGFEQATGTQVSTAWGPSMGKTIDAVPARLARHEPIDVLIMVAYALDDLAAQGVVVPGSRVPLARSGIGVVVRARAPPPAHRRPPAPRPPTTERSTASSSPIRPSRFRPAARGR